MGLATTTSGATWRNVSSLQYYFDFYHSKNGLICDYDCGLDKKKLCHSKLASVLHTGVDCLVVT